MYDILKKKGPGFPEKSVCFIMEQLLSSIAYFHDKNIVHRDIRLENIMVERVEIVEETGEEVPFMHIRVTNFRSARSFKIGNILNKKVGNVLF